MVRSNISVLETTASQRPQAPAFKVPLLDPFGTGAVLEWSTISYSRFKSDVESYAAYWENTLRRDGVEQRSVVGLWIGGFTYTDLLHIYGISRAGYVPQLFSLRLPNPVVIYELLTRANARALIYDSSYESSLIDCCLPKYAATSVNVDMSTYSAPKMPEVREEDVAFLFHTSGSTSGSPKLVPCTYRWLGSAIDKSRQISAPIHNHRQDVTTWMGSMCHIGQTFMLMGSLQHGSCVIQPTTISFSSDELVDMIHRCNLNRLNQFAAFLANHIRRSRADFKLLGMLSSLDEVLYSGLQLPRDEEEFAYKNGIKLRNLFGSTECGAMLLSDRTTPFLRPLEGVYYEFRPIAPASSDAAYQSSARLMELIILKESSDCPSVSLRGQNNDFHTGDLFQEVAPGSFLFRGRDDDWIKTENSLRCDTKAIEDNVRATCGHLITECVVVGSGRPSPAMFIEPAGEMDHSKLKKEIIRKTRQFHSRRYLHERISSANMIIIVPTQTLPRTATKGNIRRKAVEELFKPQLDQLYGIA